MGLPAIRAERSCTVKNGRTSKVLTRVSVLLLAVCLLHLCGGVLCTWYIHSIEEERDALRALLWAQPTEEVLLRLEWAEQMLGSRVYNRQARCFVIAGATGFALLCVQIERFKGRLYGGEKRPQK